MDRNTNPNNQPVELNRTSLFLGLLFLADFYHIKLKKQSNLTCELEKEL